MGDCYKYDPTVNRIGKLDNGGGGGGGGDGIQTINGKKPDSSGNYVIKSNDIPMANESTPGAAAIATSQDITDGTADDKIVTPKKLTEALNAQTIKPMRLIRFNTNITLEPNNAYALVSEDVIDVLNCELPARATFKEGDVIECEDVSGFNFKVTVTGDTLLRIDDTVISSIDGKFLVSAGRGSSIKLRALSSQLWYVVRRDRVTVSS